GTERRETPLMRDLGQWVRLVHELRELARAEKFFQRRRHRLVVDELLRHQRLDVLEAHLFLDRTLHAHEADAEMVLDELADRAHAPVAEMVDVIDRADAVPELHQVADDFEDVLLAQRPVLERYVDLQAMIELQAAD